MESQYRTVYAGGEAEITEKKSRFIASVSPVKSEEEAAAFIESLRKRYWDASHHCFAYVTGGQQKIQRCSDDGEPGGTAGRPMLDVLLGGGLCDTAVVTTRYFGGTLLGTGGLVRAYQAAVRAGLAASTVITKIRGRTMRVQTDYTGFGKIRYILGQQGVRILDTAYTDQVRLKILFPEAEAGDIAEKLREGTNGQAVLEALGECWFADVDGTIRIFEE